MLFSRALFASEAHKAARRQPTVSAPSPKAQDTTRGSIVGGHSVFFDLLIVGALDVANFSGKASELVGVYQIMSGIFGVVMCDASLVTPDPFS